MANPSEYGHARTVIQRTVPRHFSGLLQLGADPGIYGFCVSVSGGEIAAALMGSQTAKFFHEHTLVKQPGGSTVTPWHHDQPYYCVEGRQNVSLWIPLIRWRRRFRCAAFAVHICGMTNSAQRGLTVQASYAHTRFKELPDIDAHEEDYDIVSWALEPGDVVAFHFRTLHGAKGNLTARSRRVFSARWVGDDATFADRGG